MEKKFNLIATEIKTEQTKVGKNTVEQLKKEYTDEKGHVHTIVLREKKDLENAIALDFLKAIGDKAGLGICYELSVCNPKAYGCKTIGEVGARFYGYKAGTANQYARVGKHFVKKSITEKGVDYHLIDLVEGVTQTNLVQILSLVDEEADNEETALEEFTKAILPDENGKCALNLYAPLSDLKKQVKAYKDGASPDGVIADVNPKELSSEKVEEKPDFSTILNAIEKLPDEKKLKAVELVQALQELLS